MDVIETCFSRFPPNWWHVISPIDNHHPDDVLRYLPFKHDFLMHEFRAADLLRLKTIDLRSFNARFTGKFKLTRFRSKGGKYLIFLRVLGKGPVIRHKPQHQKDDVAILELG